MKRILAIIYGCLCTWVGYAQQWSGIQASNYAGTNVIYQNPARIADSRHKLYVNLVGNSFWITNSFFAWNRDFAYWAMFSGDVPDEYLTPSGKVIFDKSYFDLADASKRVSMYAISEVRGPAIMYSINAKNSIAVQTRLRTGGSVENMSAALGALVYRGINNAPVTGEAINVAGTRSNGHSFAELGVTYARVLTDEEDENFLSVGLSVKRMVGIFAGYGVSHTGSYRMIKDPRNPQLNTVQVENVTGNYGFVPKEVLKNATVDWLWNDAAPSYGLGVDIGVVYEYRPNIDKYISRRKRTVTVDATQNKYLFRIGASLMDIGKLHFATRTYAVNASTSSLTPRDFPPNSSLSDISNTIIANLKGKEVGMDEHFPTTLPTTLQIQADYLLKKNVYVGATWVQNLTNQQAFGLKVPSSLSLVPRYEHKHVEWSLPLVLFDDYTKFAFGTALRIGPFWLGTDNLGSLLNLGKPRGLDAYFALAVPIYQKKPVPFNDCWYEGKEANFWQRLLKKRKRQVY